MTKIIIQKEYDEELFDSIKTESNKVPDVHPETKILFLDVDGLLNNRKWLKENPNLPFNQQINIEAVRKVNGLLAITNSKIVISSSWRRDFLYLSNGFSKMVEFFQLFGITNIVGMTPHFPGKMRCEEIRAWLDEYGVKNFVILDDDFCANVDNRQIKTNFDDGLQDHHIDAAIRLFNESE